MENVSIQQCDKDNIKFVVDGLNRYNLNKVKAVSDVWTPLDFVAKDKSGNKLGGIIGGIGYWNGLEIKALWVDEAYRKQGLGTHLLKHIETLAQSKGAYVSMVDTFDFQAETFYIKQGYKKIGELDNFPKGHKRIYLSKHLIV